MNFIVDNKHFKFHVPMFYCDFISDQRSRTQQKCNWYVENERYVYHEGKWVIISRQENVRDLLVCPNPKTPNTKNGNHMTNKQLVTNEEFWVWVLDRLVNNFLKKFCVNNLYPVECFALNFGKWESAEAKDQFAMECHGHMHLYIVLDVARKMESDYDSMKGKLSDPINYSLQNCIELETE
jgi:hypothetical protein